MTRTRAQKPLTYWQELLAGELPLLNLPVDYPRTSILSTEQTSYSFTLDAELQQRLEHLAQAIGISGHALLLAAFQILLYRYTEQEDILVGIQLPNHSSFGADENPLSWRVHRMSLPGFGSSTFRDFSTKVHQRVQLASDHPIPIIAELIEQLQIKPDSGYAPLFQAGFVYHSEELFNSDQKIPSVAGRSTPLDLTLTVTQDMDKSHASLAYNSTLFKSETIACMAEHLLMLLDGMTHNPDQSIAALPLLTKEEQLQMLVEWNVTETKYPKDKCVHQLFEEQVIRTPDAVVLVGIQDTGSHDQVLNVSSSATLTYRELNERANQLAHHLQTLDLGPDRLVGICVERTMDMTVGLLGILKAGCAYVPFDPAYPKERIAFMIQDSQVSVLLTQTKLLASLPENQAQVVSLDTLWDSISEMSTDNPNFDISPNDLAYVLYTSGSTGRPKGVATEHSGIVALIDWVYTVFSKEELSGVMASTSLCFDPSVFETFVPLSGGGKIILAENALHLPQVADRHSGTHDITYIGSVPSAMSELALSKSIPPTVRVVVLAGEPLTNEVVQLIYQNSNVQRVVNLYGVTEDSVYTTCAISERGNDWLPTIGRPISNRQLYIVDQNLQAVPIGMPGQILISGSGLARGYYKRPDLTAERFIDNPFAGHSITKADGTMHVTTPQSKRVYKSGDVARYRPDGTLEFLGRMDNQVKVRGFRIELGEIEATLRQRDDIEEAVVIAREEGNGDKQLIAYLVPSLEANTEDAKQVSQWLSLYETVYGESNPTKSTEQAIIGQTDTRQGTSVQDITFNLAAWNSSYTGTAIPQEEMQEWVEHTVEEILALEPRCAMEIGCGTGLLLSRVAPNCDEYWGTDFSDEALQYIQQIQKSMEGLGHVKLVHTTADNFDQIPEKKFDVIILNSVAQHFPSINYLLRVLEGAVKCLKPGGKIYAGDIRSFQLYEAYHASVQFFQAPDELTRNQLKQRIQQAQIQEEELLIDPDFFLALQQHLPQINQVQIKLKHGHYHNEMTRFRYQVVLRVEDETDADITDLSTLTWLDWHQEQLTFDGLRQYLVENQPKTLAVRGIPNARLETEEQIVAWLGGFHNETASELRQKMKINGAVDPEALWKLQDELPYVVNILWSSSGTGGLGAMDAVFQNKSAQQTAVLCTSTISESHQKPWQYYANYPSLGVLNDTLVPKVRQSLQDTLPDHMVPATFVLLESLPLTPNGKLDRGSLPAPSRDRVGIVADLVAPETDLEQMIAEIWQETLNLDSVGIHDPFFEIGGHSLLLVQIRKKITDQSGLQLSIVDLLQYPTIYTLAEYLNKVQAGQSHSLPSQADSNEVAIQEEEPVQRGQSTRQEQRRRRLRARKTRG